MHGPAIAEDYCSNTDNSVAQKEKTSACISIANPG
jgi:hypothetical protein